MNWTTKELIEKHASLIHQLTQDGHGCRFVAREVESRTKRGCSKNVAHSAMRYLKTRPKVTIEEEKPATVGGEEETIEDLIESRIGAARRKRNKWEKHHRKFTIPCEPTGFLIMGDPHVDNDGCDWAKLSRDLDLIETTGGILTSCVGDLNDNWIGRLARLYSNASVTAADGIRLSEWMLEHLDFVVGGNHDAWANGPGFNMLGRLCDANGVRAYADDQLDLTLSWADRPDVEPVIIRLRHDFAGRSWFHPTHGPHKEAMLDGRVHLLAAGHIHNWGQLATEQRYQRCTQAIRVRGYKRCDEFAMSKGFPEQAHGESCLAILEPESEGPGRISIFWDLERGCEFLTWRRGN